MLHIIDLHTGRLCDTRTLKCDKVVLSYNQGLYLYKNILAILSMLQTIHVFPVTPEDTFMGMHTIGRFCSEDDLLTVSAIFPEVQRDSQMDIAYPFRDPVINSLKHRLLVYLWHRAHVDADHLFFKPTSEDVVMLRGYRPLPGVFLYGGQHGDDGGQHWD